MIARFAEAIRLLIHHWRLLTAIILTVWFPGNLIVNYVAYNVGDITATIRMKMLIEGVFGPIYIGALIYALFRIKSGRTVTYREAMSVGLKNWGTLFVARLVAGLIMGLGFLALIIPGLILAVRYSLLDSAVIIEGHGASQSLARSTELTIGLRWQIFLSTVIFFAPFLLFSFAIYLPLGLIQSLNVMYIEVFLDCILDIVYATIQIVMFLFYWDATHGIKAPNNESMDATRDTRRAHF